MPGKCAEEGGQRLQFEIRGCTFRHSDFTAHNCCLGAAAAPIIIFRYAISPGNTPIVDDERMTTALVDRYRDQNTVAAALS